MSKLLIAGLMTAAFAASPVYASSASSPDELALRSALQSATWPGDIVRLADEYLAQFPGGEYATDAGLLRERANDAMRALSQRQVQLFRSAFTSYSYSPAVSSDTRRAALADPDAAVRLAHLHRALAEASAAERARYLGWLQYASELGNERAAYELAVHYRGAGQPVLAARYETRAIERGFVPPTYLDNVRK